MLKKGTSNVESREKISFCSQLYSPVPIWNSRNICIKNGKELVQKTTKSETKGT